MRSLVLLRILIKKCIDDVVGTIKKDERQEPSKSRVCLPSCLMTWKLRLFFLIALITRLLALKVEFFIYEPIFDSKMALESSGHPLHAQEISAWYDHYWPVSSPVKKLIFIILKLGLGQNFFVLPIKDFMRWKAETWHADGHNPHLHLSKV